MKEYLILISEDSSGELAPVESQHCMTAYGEWATALGEKHIIARRLDDSQGKFLESRRDPVTDGPFAEAKELLAGIILINAESIEEAEEIARACPLNDYFHLYVKKTFD